MQRIHPITVKGCRPYYGKPVLLYLTDGTEVTGVLSRVEGGKLYLNEQTAAGQADKVVTLKKKAQTTAKLHAMKKASAAKKSAAGGVAPQVNGPYPDVPYGYGPGAPLAFDLSAIAALFVLN